MNTDPDYPVTTDRRYFVVRGRLWRMSDPALAEATRARLVKDLMSARSALRSSSAAERPAVRARIDEAKTALGERGPVWWDDGAPDYNRHLAKNTPYKEWWEQLAARR